MLAMFGFAAHAQLLPNEDSPVGFLYDFNKDNYTYYTSEYVPSGVAAGSITTEDNNLKYTGTSNSSTFQLQLYKTVAGGVPGAGVDISANPVVYLKIKGKVDDVLEMAIKNKSYYDANTDETIPERYFGGYTIRQKITCSDYSWYKFDFTKVFAQQAPDYKDVTGTDTSATKNHIYMFEFSNKGNLTGRANYEFVIDSVILGKTGVTPTLPANSLPTLFNGDFTNDWFRGSQPGGNTISVSGGVMTCNISASAKSNQGIQYQLNDGSKNQLYDISSYPKVVASVKAAVGDTILVNLISKSDYTLFVSGWDALKVLKSNDFETLTFDFTGLADAAMGTKEVYLVEFVHNPKTTGAATFYMNSLTLGKATEKCSVVGVKDEKLTEIQTDVYPNPAAAGETITLSNKFNTVDFVNLQGMTLATVNTQNQSVQIPSELNAGMYIMVMKGKDVKSYAKFQIK